MKNKLPIIIIIIVFLITAVIGTLFILNMEKEPETVLSVQYIGGDKFIGQSVKNDDFTVVYLPTNTKLNSNDFMLENVVLNLNGTNVKILYTTPDGNMVETTTIVYPTLTITSINANLVNHNRFIGSSLLPEDFDVVAIDNKGNQYNITNFSISPNILETEETDVTITYTLNNQTFTSIVHIKTGENYFTELEAIFVGNKNFIGRGLINEDFIVNAVYADGAKRALTDFVIVNPILTEENTVVTISARNNRDEHITTEVTVEGKNYIKEISSIMYVGDSQTVGNKISISDFKIYGLKSDGSIQELKNCKIESGEKLTTTSNSIQISYYNEIGELLIGHVIVRADDNIIFIGDSRTQALKDALIQSRDLVYYIYTENAEYNWFKDVAIPEVQSIMDKNIYTKYRVVINVGLFDTENVEQYATLIKDLASDKWANHQIYVNSLNPIDEIKMDEIGKYSRSIVNTSKIKEFNTLMPDYLGTDKTNIKFLNTNGSIINNGFFTTDGINYNIETYFYYYDLIKSLTY